MTTFDLPAELTAVFREFRTCEFSTLARDGTPITWPVTPLFRPETGRFFIATSIGLPQKAFNIRRNPWVSLLFSDPTASGLTDAPAVLVQGDAEGRAHRMNSVSAMGNVFKHVDGDQEFIRGTSLTHARPEFRKQRSTLRQALRRARRRAQRGWLVQVEHIPSGEKAYFTSLEEFFAFIRAQLAGPQRVEGAEKQGSTGV